jgi:hypothetical protein
LLSSPGIAVRKTASLPLAYARAIQYAAASRLNYHRLWNTGSPAFAGDDGLSDPGYDDDDGFNDNKLNQGEVDGTA